MSHTFPAIYSVLSPEAIISDVLPGFNIGAVRQCQFFTGGFNDTYQIQTTDNHTFYLRAYRIQWRTLADIQYELDVLNHLKLKGFPAARPVPHHTGEYFYTLQAPEGVRHLALFTEAPGSEISYDQNPQEMAQRYGLAMADMHNALDDFSSPHPRFHLDLEHFIEGPLRNIEPFLRKHPDDWRFIQTFAEDLRQQILSLPAADLEQGFCHGDLQCYHANLSSDGTMTFFDFDCGGFGYRAYDLSVFLWCSRLEEAVETRWEPFLAAYRSRRAVQPLDLQAVPLFVCARYLWHIGVHTQNSPDWGVGNLNEKYFERHLGRLRQAKADFL